MQLSKKHFKSQNFYKKSAQRDANTARWL